MQVELIMNEHRGQMNGFKYKFISHMGRGTTVYRCTDNMNFIPPVTKVLSTQTGDITWVPVMGVSTPHLNWFKDLDAAIKWVTDDAILSRLTG